MSNRLKYWFNNSNPIGFIETPDDLVKTKHRKNFTDFFDSQNFLSKCILEQCPSAILGRRGSGKTAILYHLKHHGGFAISVELETYAMFDEVASNIDRRMTSSSGAHDSFVENYSKIWGVLLTTAVICAAYDVFSKDSRYASDPDVATINIFLTNAGLLKVRKPHQILRTLIRGSEKAAKVMYNLEDEFDFLSDFIDGMFVDEHGYEAARDALETLLEDSGARALILMDSLEQFPINRMDMRNSLAGLLNFAGKLKRNPMPIDLSFAFPAELHEELKDSSSNVEKDFNSVLTLHWDVEEIFHICAHRFEVYRSLHPGEWQSDINPPSDTLSREQLWDYWHQFLPAEMTNRLGIVEDSIAYISRHTQLLPRHFINILNEILTIGVRRESPCFPVSSDTVVQAVRAVEDTICEGILNGFRQKFFTAFDLCELIIPHLPNVFNRKFMIGVIRDHGKGIMPNADEVISTFIRIGAIGAVHSVTDRYVECRFDYTYNGQMPYNVDASFGLHPAFAGRFRGEAWAPEDQDLAKPIYPLETFVGQRPGVSRL